MTSSRKSEAHVVVAALEPAAEADLDIAQELGHGGVLFAGQLDLEAAVDLILVLQAQFDETSTSGAYFFR